MNQSEELRARRKNLVIAAETVIKASFSSGKKLDLKKSQLNHLVGVCGEAACAEEIENYIRYQAGRGSDKTGWDLDLAHQVIAGMGEPSRNLSDADKLSAWALYAVYLTRAFTYQDKASGNGGAKGAGKDRFDKKGDRR